jgi:hypothetical protein
MSPFQRRGGGSPRRDRLLEAVAPTDHERRSRLSRVAPLFQLLRECGGAELLALLVEKHGSRHFQEEAGSLPPLSGSSLIFVGQAMRFR